MAKKVFFNFFLGAVIFYGHFFFLSGLGESFFLLELPLVALIAVLFINGFRVAVYWALGLGIFYDFFSLLPFGSFTFAFLSLTFFGDFLFRRIFTNFSIYSFSVLDLFFVIFKPAFLGFFAFFLSWGADYDIHLNLSVRAIFLNLFLAVAVFYFLKIVVDKFNPSLLKSR